MKILFFHKTPSGTGGGASQYVMDILPRIRAEGHSVALVHSRDTPSEFRGTGYLFEEINEARVLNEKARARLEAIVEDFVPDLVQMHQVPNHHIDSFLHGKVPVFRFIHHHQNYCSGENMTWKLPLQICGKAHGRTCLLRHIASRCGSRNPAVNIMRFRRVGQRLEILRRATRIQTLSPQIRDNLLLNGIPPDKIEVLPAPVAEPLPLPPAAFQGRRMVLHVGGLMSKKGIWVAIRTLREMPDDCDLVFAGGGEDLPRVEEHVRRRGLGGRIRIFPHVSEVEWAKLYHRCELVIMPCLWNEPLGLAALRATAYRKPVAAIAAGGISTWLEDGINGILLPLAQRQQFPTAVGQLLRQPELLWKYGENARKMWEEKHRMESHLAALLASYQEVLKKTH